MSTVTLDHNYAVLQPQPASTLCTPCIVLQILCPLPQWLVCCTYLKGMVKHRLRVTPKACTLVGFLLLALTQSMQFQSGAHHFRVEIWRWLKPRLLAKATEGGLSEMHVVFSIEDEHNVLSERPVYHHIRSKCEDALHSTLGIVTGC